MYWSSEIVLRNELLPGCGAAVRKQMSEVWLPSTPGCETPLITVKSRRWSLSSSRYGDATYSRPLVVGKNRSGSTPRFWQMANIRRGFAPGASGDDVCAARANGESIESSIGSASATPAPCRKSRRDSGCRVVT